MQQHNMKLNKLPFERVEREIKLLELRLFDEKRQQIKVGDTICFAYIEDEARTVKVRVIGLLQYSSFSRLLKDTPMRLLGYEESQRSTIISGMREFYTEEQEKKYGVLGIRIERV